MLGEKIGDFVGKTTGRRVLQGGRGPTMEVSIQQQGTLLGVNGVDYGTYEAVLLGRHLEGKGQGIFMTADGEAATWTATGIGNFTGKGSAVAWRGALTYQTSSTKLSRLNGLCVVFEHDVDETGDNSVSRLIEWK